MGPGGSGLRTERRADFENRQETRDCRAHWQVHEGPNGRRVSTQILWRQGQRRHRRTDRQGRLRRHCPGRFQSLNEGGKKIEKRKKDGF